MKFLPSDVSVFVDPNDELSQPKTEFLGTQKLHYDTSNRQLTPRMIVALEALVSRDVDETYESIAQRGGVSRNTLYRYMDDPAFMAEYQRRVRMEFRGVRMQVAKKLISQAVQGDAQSQRLYWQLSGMLSETIEFNTGPPRNIESSATLDIDKMSPEARRVLLEEIKLAGSGVSEGARREEREEMEEIEEEEIEEEGGEE